MTTAHHLAHAHSSLTAPLRGVARLLPGVLLSATVGAAAYGLQLIETALFGHPWVEGLVIAILMGAALRLVWTPSSLWTPGIAFSAKTLLEVAVALLGATVSGAAVMALGPVMLLAIMGVVALAILGGYALGRAFGLPPAMALLVAWGNAICGNSAIAAVAPVIEAEGEDVAAAAPAGMLAVQTGAVVKLVRVLMLGPVCLVLGLMRSGKAEGARRPRLHHMAPWFIIVFLILMGLRSGGLIPEIVLPPLQAGVTAITLIAMAALGLMVDPKAVVRAGPRVAAVAALSALLIGALALATIVLILPA